MRKFKDYYQVLGISSRSHARDIEESYWEQAHAIHAQRTRSANQRLKAINEAYETLGSPHKRAEYDIRWRQNAAQAAGQPRPGFFGSLVGLLGKAFRPD